MINNFPLTFEQRVDVILEGIFLDSKMRKDICNKIINDVKHYMKLHKMTTDIGSIQTAVNWVLYNKLMS